MTNKVEPFLTRSHIFAVIFFLIFIFLLYQMAGLLAPFASALIWAAMLTLAGYPVFLRIVKLLKGRRGLAAGIMTVIVSLVIIGPAIALLIALTSQALSLYQWTTDAAQSGRLEQWSTTTTLFLNKILDHPALAGIDFKSIVVKSIGDLSMIMAAQLGSVLKNTLVLLFELAVMILAVFFFYRDGEIYHQFLMDLLPFTNEQKRSILKRFIDTFRAVLNGVFLIALLQGLVTGIGFAILGVPYPAFWGSVAVAAALIPVGGAALIWIPGAVFLILTGHMFQGIVLSLWGLLLVSLPDNFLKPLLIGRKAKIPTFFLFLGILGGIRAYGVLGIVFGPLVVTLLTAFVQIYREEYARE